jgi:hypothetical protein
MGGRNKARGGFPVAWELCPLIQKRIAMRIQTLVLLLQHLATFPTKAEVIFKNQGSCSRSFDQHDINSKPPGAFLRKQQFRSRR